MSLKVNLGSGAGPNWQTATSSPFAQNLMLHEKPCAESAELPNCFMTSRLSCCVAHSNTPHAGPGPNVQPDPQSHTFVIPGKRCCAHLHGSGKTASLMSECKERVRRRRSEADCARQRKPPTACHQEVHEAGLFLWISPFKSSDPNRILHKEHPQMQWPCLYEAVNAAGDE